MKLINISLIIILSLIVFIVGSYFVLDILFSFGLMNASVDIRDGLLVTGYILVALFICLLILMKVVRTKNK